LEIKATRVDEYQYRSQVTSGTLDFSGSIFYHPDFLKVASEILNLTFQPVICHASGELAGIANIFTSGKFNVKTAIIPRLFQYYGPISLTSVNGIFESVCKVIKNDVDTAVFSLTAEEYPKSSYSGWQKAERLTYYLTPDTFKNMKGRCFADVKNKVNKAIKSGVKVVAADRFPYELYEASFKRKDVKPPLDKTTTINWVERLTRLKLAETYIAVVDEKPAAFRTQLVYKSYAYDWLAGSDASYSKLGVNQFLLLKIGERHYHNGVKNWDLLGGDIKSIGDFKKSFGSTPKTHLQIEKNFSLKGKIYRKLMKFKAGFNG